MKKFTLSLTILLIICFAAPVFSQTHLVTLDLIANEKGNTPFITHLYQLGHFSTWFQVPLTGKWMQLGAGVRQDIKGIKTTWLLASLFSCNADQKRMELEGVLPIIFVTAEKGLGKLELQNRYYIEFPTEKISYDWLRSDLTFGKSFRFGARNELKALEKEDKKTGEKRVNSRLGPIIKCSFSPKASVYLWFGWDVSSGTLKTIMASTTVKF